MPPECGKYNRWEFIDNHFSWSQSISKVDIQKKIEKKADKLPKYKEKYGELILLIVADATYGSGMFHDIPQKIVLKKCGFAFVYLARYPDSYIEIG